MTEEPVFIATSIEIGQCTNPNCRAVHIHLQDEGGVMRAQAVLCCEVLDGVIADLISLRDRIGSASPRSTRLN